MTKAGVAVSLTYDPLGRLSKVGGSAISDRTFLYDGDAMVAEYSSGGAMQQRWVHGPNAAADDPLIQFDHDGNVSWLHSDHLGSIVALTDGSGGNPAINRYDEYGVPASTNAGRFQFTGQVWLPEIGLYYYKARMYDPSLGRFLQTDPVGYEGGINLYGYVEADPINRGDYTGLICTGSLNEAACQGGTIASGNSGSSTMTPEDHARNQDTARQSSSLVAPINPPISQQQAALAEKRLGYSNNGPSESYLKWTQPGWKLIAARYEAFRAQTKAGYSAWNDEGDAKRHLLWNIRMSHSIGAENAKMFGDAHERSGGSERGERLMDLINNHNGRVLSQMFPGASPEMLADWAVGHHLLQTAPVGIEP